MKHAPCRRAEPLLVQAGRASAPFVRRAAIATAALTPAYFAARILWDAVAWSWQ